jgi:FkbH-like protein
VTLARRGIISSICSKNDHATAVAALSDLGMMEYFVLPKIEFGPKGQNVAAIIEAAALRPENVLFIDDNVINLEEAKHVSPGLMTADPRDILPGLLDLPETAGKDDSELTRLKQYKLIEAKVAERSSSGLGNEEFLRQCDIRVEIDSKSEPEFDRIVELANRTNQLNFTKVRLEKPKALAKFREILGEYGTSAAVIRVSDRYGDYGIVGFFVMRRNAKRNLLKHFVFSCRTMNMGIEQYVYELLQKPEIDLRPPVANEISPFPVVDWISEGYGQGHSLSTLTSSKKLTLVGGCELLQLSSMCSSNREEYVNTVRHGVSVRFDDPGFIAGNREKIANDDAVERLKYWTSEDAVRFDRALSESEIVITALYSALGVNFFETPGGVLTRLSRGALRARLKEDNAWFTQNMKEHEFSIERKFDLLSEALDRMGRLTPASALHFALGVNTAKMEGLESLAKQGWPQCLLAGKDLAAWLEAYNTAAARERFPALRHVYNRFLQDYCDRNRNFVFVDVNALIRPEDLFNEDEVSRILPDHFKRSGYIAIADHIREHLREATPVEESVAA